MTRKFRWLGLAGLVACMAAVAACGEDKKEEPTPSACEGVVCTDGMACNPAFGACTCGDGDLTCEDGTVCSLDPTPTCVSIRCEFTTCTNGLSCDSDDGLCKCSGVSCEDGEWCIQGQCVAGNRCEGVVCQANETCDPSDGACRCGEGAGCGFGQRCEDGECRASLCEGNQCGAGFTCSEDDGLCHCGGAEGPVCSGGEACVVDEDGARCEGVDLCADAATRCGVGTTCDRADGQCRCGGVGSSAPVCEDGQTCHEGRCVGGDVCAGVQCSGGNSCDPEDGLCKCGGLFGDTCTTDEVCLNRNDGKEACVQTCEPLRSGQCGEGQGCYFNPVAPGGGQAFCGKAGTLPVDSTCRGDMECAPGNHCSIPTGGTSGKCRAFCSVSERPQCGGAGFCAPLNGSDEDLGICVPIP